MARRTKGFTAKQSARTSRRMQNSTVGSHVSRTGTRSRTRTGSGADSVSFSSSRGQRRAARGQVDALLPSTTTRDNAAAYRTRVGHTRYAAELKRKSRVRRFGVVAIAVAIVLAIAVGAGIIAYMGSVGATLALKDSDAKDVLVPAQSGKPYYALVCVELGSVAVPLDNGGPDVLLLARVDEAQHSVALIGVPENLQVAYDDNRRYSISSTAADGDAALIGAVQKFTGVSISHIVKIDEAGVAGLIDALDGVSLTLPEDIDDPHAGDLYLKSGPRNLTGAQALVFLRATNLRLGQTDQAANQLNVAALVLEKLFSTSGALNFAARLDAIGQFIQTDWSSNDLISLNDKLGGISANSIVRATVPGYVSAETGVVSQAGSKFVGSSEEAAKLIAQIEEGTYQGSWEKIDTSGIDPGSFTIEIQNGANIVGAAAATQELLGARGFNIVEIGNAEQPVYTETLVVCQTANDRARAQAVIDALGLGRIVDSSAYYSFDTDILLILGSDYKPVA